MKTAAFQGTEFPDNTGRLEGTQPSPRSPVSSVSESGVASASGNQPSTRGVQQAPQTSSSRNPGRSLIQDIELVSPLVQLPLEILDEQIPIL